MFVQYIFEIHPLTMILIGITSIFFAYLRTLPKVKKNNPNSLSNVETIPFKYIKTSSKEVSDKDGVSVLSYNIMAYNFTKGSWFPYCDMEFLQTRYRAPKILKEILDLSADIVCLQECDHDLFLEFYKPNLEKNGYTCLINFSNPNKIVTIIVAFKKSKLTLLSSDFLDLNKDLEKLDESFIKHKEAYICLFNHKELGKKFTCTSTHLFWNPEYEYVKYGQINKIITTLEKKYASYPAIVCGDLNSQPWSNVIRYFYRVKPLVNSLSKGDYYKNKSFMENFFNESCHNFKFTSSYENYKKNLKKNFDLPLSIKNGEVDEAIFNEIADFHPDYTNFTDEFNGCLDYIFYTNQSLLLQGILEIPNTQEIKNLKLPNYLYPSDHLKICAKFSFK